MTNTAHSSPKGILYKLFLAASPLVPLMAMADESIQARIDAASKAGGGVVEVCAGLHESDALVLKSGVTLRLAEGAVLKAKTAFEAFAPTEGHAFILAEHSDNVAIEGPGVIDGSGEAFPEGSLEVYQQPRLVWFRDSRNVRIENVTLRNGRRWSCYFDRCDGVVARKVTIRSTFQKCCDGIDLECRNALVEDCDIESHDDAICFKNRSSDYTVRNVEVRNCRLATNCSFIKFGTETLGTIRDIHVHDCELRVTSHSFFRIHLWERAEEFGSVMGPVGMAGITLQMNDGGILENVHIHDINMVSGVGVPIAIRLTERKSRVMPGRSALRNVTIENVKGRSILRPACSVIGTRSLRPSDITFRNIELEMDASGEPSCPVPEIEPGASDVTVVRHSIYPAYGFFLRHADNVKFDNVRIRPRGLYKRSLVIADDCTGIELSGLKRLPPK